MTSTEVVEVIKVGAVIVSLLGGVVALTAYLYRLVRWLGTLPPETDAEREAEARLIGTMEPVQLTWTRFRLWCATGPAERLTWRQHLSFALWCPLQGHRLERFRPGGSFGGRCINCDDTIVRDSEESLDLWERKGWHPHHRTKLRVRPQPAAP